MRTYYSLMRSTDVIQIETLVESHMAMESSLHLGARATQPDVAALTYSSLRLPGVMPRVEIVVIGQMEKSFVDAGYTDVETWERVFSPGRRRRIHYDGVSTLAVFIASRSDIDDLVPMLTAYQIEWNKIHQLLQTELARTLLVNVAIDLSMDAAAQLASILQLQDADVLRLKTIWGTNWAETLRMIASARKSIGVRALSSSVADYRKATVYWWRELEDEAERFHVDPEQRPVYFVSSNTHALPNLLTGYAWRNQAAIIDFVQAHGDNALRAEYSALQETKNASPHNFLYYTLKKFVSQQGDVLHQQIEREERDSGIFRVPNRYGFQIEAQIIDLARLNPDWLDPRLCAGLDHPLLAASDALIINIDYPLGLAAYEIMSRLTERVGHLLGVYVMGKAATLNGRVGDVMIPNVVHDEHSQNTYLFNNCFTARDVRPYITYGMVLDNQKAISAPGTFLQNSRYMSVFYHEGYTDIEMEAGPYLSAVYEAYRPKRHPQNEIVNLYGVPFEVGLLHYASDTPFGRGHNLGVSNLGYAGVDSTYATAVAILRRIFQRETERIRQRL